MSDVSRLQDLQFFPNSTGATFNGGEFYQAHNINYHINRSGQINGYKLLSENAVPAATHDSSERFDPPRCHPNTRIAILLYLETWTRDTQNRSRLMWLSGAAGSGKSAIAQSIAERMQDHHHVPISFFFSLTGGERRNTTKWLVSTLAYQLATHSQEEIKTSITRAVENDPHIFSKSLFTQLYELLAKPLLSSGSDIYKASAVLLIIDGLDECGDESVQCDIIHVFAAVLRQYNPPICVIFASRREPHIVNCFNEEAVLGISSHIVLDDKEHEADRDIKVFLKSHFERIRSTHTLRLSLPADWPIQTDIQKLVSRASGQFIYASTIISFIDNLHESPVRTLQVILGLSPPRKNEKPFSQLDKLYTYILSTSMVQQATRQVLEAVVALTESKWQTSSSPCFIDQILSFDPGESQLALSRLHSIIFVPSDPNWDIRFHHKSFTDYALDQKRSGEYFLDIQQGHLWILQGLHRLYGPDKPGRLKILEPNLGILPVGEYAYFHFIDHLTRLEISVAQNLLGNIDLTKLPRACGNQEDDFTIDYLLYSIEQLLDVCKSPETPDRRFALVKLKDACDEYLHQCLEKYPAEEHLLVFFAIALSLCQDGDDLKHMPFYGEPRQHKAQLINEIYKAYNTKLSIVSILEVDAQVLNIAKLAISKSLSRFFTDQTRAGKYFVHGEAISQATICLINYFFGNELYTLPATDDDEDDFSIEFYHILGIRNTFFFNLKRADPSYKLTECLLHINFRSERVQNLYRKAAFSKHHRFRKRKASMISFVESYLQQYFVRFGKTENDLWSLFALRYQHLVKKVEEEMESDHQTAQVLPELVTTVSRDPHLVKNMEEEMASAPARVLPEPVSTVVDEERRHGFGKCCVVF